MSTDLNIDDPRWNALDLQGLADAAVSATLAHHGLDPQAWEISLLACDDTRIAALNAQFRDKPHPTNVLSWPAADLGADRPGGEPARPTPDITGQGALGDVAIAWDTCTREAGAGGKPMADHVTHLIVHAVLHLLGYDHVRDPDATVMQRHEVEILGNLGIDDPYMGADGSD